MPPVKKRKAARRAKRKPTSAVQGSDFMRAFAQRFIAGPDATWPTQSHDGKKILSDLATFTAVLFRGAVSRFPIASVAHESTGPITTAEVLQFVNEYKHPGPPLPLDGWPAGEAVIASARKARITARTYRIAEISGIVRLLLQAVASFEKLGDGGGGGAGTKIPPTLTGP